MRSVSFLDKDIRLRRPQASSDAVPLRVAARCAMHSTPRGAGDATCSGPMQTYRESPAVCPADAQGVCCVRSARVAWQRLAALSITGMLPLPRDPGAHPVRGAAADAMVGRFREGFGACLLAPVEVQTLKKPGLKSGRLAGGCAAITTARCTYRCVPHERRRWAMLRNDNG